MVAPHAGRSGSRLVLVGRPSPSRLSVGLASFCLPLIGCGFNPSYSNMAGHSLPGAPWCLAYKSELPRHRSLRLTKLERQEIKNAFDIPVRNIEHKIVLAVPATRLADRYLRWTKSVKRQRSLGAPLAIRVLEINHFIKVFGNKGVRDFHLAMDNAGRPPISAVVHLVRDSRRASEVLLDEHCLISLL